MVLLRGAVAALRAAGHRVSLLAPVHAARVLLGGGPSEVEAVLDWDQAPAASLLSGPPIHPEMTRALSPFQAVVAYTGEPALARALGATGARVIVHPPRPPAAGPHAARWLADGVAALGTPTLAEPPLLVPSPEERTQARAWLDRLPAGFLAVHPGSGSPAKNWAPEGFAALVEEIASDTPWLLVEGPADEQASRALARHPRTLVARDLPVRVLGAVLAGAGLYVGNDSGVSHLAAAFGARVVALFGPTDPSQWSPVGPRVSVLRSTDGAMPGLAVAQVVAAARAALSSPRPPCG